VTPGDRLRNRKVRSSPGARSKYESSVSKPAMSSATAWAKRGGEAERVGGAVGPGVAGCRVPLAAALGRQSRSTIEDESEGKKTKHRTQKAEDLAQQVVQADTDKRRVFGLRRFSASLSVCRGSRRLSVRLNLVVTAVPEIP